VERTTAPVQNYLYRYPIDNGSELQTAPALERSIFWRKADKMYYGHPSTRKNAEANEKQESNLRRLLSNSTNLDKVQDKRIERVTERDKK
jgi:IS30 family transposase